MSRLPLVLRVALFGVLLVLAFAPPRGRDGGRVVELGPDRIDSELHVRPARAFVRRSTAAPSADELLAIQALAGRAPLVAARPALPLLTVRPPDRPIAGRAGALSFRLIGVADDSILLRLSDTGGVLDSATIVLDEGGGATGAFTVRPPAAGWHEWSLAAGPAVATTGAWVRPARRLRVLVVPGPASWEGREVGRALERGGAEVTLAQPLGRGLAVGDAPAGLPASAATLAGWDVVIVLAGAPLDEPRRRALRTFRSAGGGVLVAGNDEAPSEPDSLDARAVRWSAEPGIAPLPPLDLVVPAVSLADAAGAARIVATAPGGAPLLILSSAGRGRSAALGLTETWRWGLQAGHTDALSAFWTGLAEWLAGGVRAGIDVSAEPVEAPVGAAIEIALAAHDPDTVPRELRLRGPAGRDESLPVMRTGRAGHARFVAQGPGLHTIALPGDTAAAAGHMARPPADAGDPGTATPSDAWFRLALLAHRSGGTVVPADSVDAALASLEAVPRARSPALLLLIAALLLAFGEWLLRRLRGRP